MAFAILRVAKIKSAGAAGALSAHLERTMEVLNADPELRNYNKRVKGSGDLWQDIKKTLDDNDITEVRKNGVYAIEILMTASPEHFNLYKVEKEDGSVGLRGNSKKWENFDKNCQNWLVAEFGRNNIANYTIHLDEGTPHIHAVIVPLADTKKTKIIKTLVKGPDNRVGYHKNIEVPIKKLSAKSFIDGRATLRGLQDSFAEIHKESGLKRGIEGSKATHTSVKEFYGALKEKEVVSKDLTPNIEKIDFENFSIPIPEPGVMDRLDPKAYAEKAVKLTLQALKPNFDNLRIETEKVASNQKRTLSLGIIDAMKIRGKKVETLAEKRLLVLENIVKETFGHRPEWDIGKDTGELVNLEEEKQQKEKENKAREEKIEKVKETQIIQQSNNHKNGLSRR